jgi:hypothetical protein
MPVDMPREELGIREPSPIEGRPGLRDVVAEDCNGDIRRREARDPGVPVHLEDISQIESRLIRGDEPPAKIHDEGSS